MQLKKLVFIVISSILFFIKPNEVRSQDLIINNNKDSIHCKILAVKGDYYYYKTFLDLTSQVKIINVNYIRDTIRNYFPYEYNRDSAAIVNRYYYLKNLKREEVKASKISLNYGIATMAYIPNNFASRVLYEELGMPYVNNYWGLNFSQILYKNFGLTASVSNINSNKSSQIKVFNGVANEFIPISMKLSNWNYNLGLTYISSQKRFPKFSWQFSSEMGYYQYRANIDYTVKYEMNSDALSWRNSAIIEYAVYKNLNVGLCGFLQLSKNKLYSYKSATSSSEVENPKGPNKFHTYVGTTVSISYFLFNKH